MKELRAVNQLEWLDIEEISMKVIKVRNVNEALSSGIELIRSEGSLIPSRGGPTLEIPEPVATVYEKPWERVLISKVRDANPFFHLMEAIWILGGRKDVKFLAEFNKRMAEYSDNGQSFNAPYGYRLRSYFLDSGNCNIDQLDEIVSMLKRDPASRQAVAQIWDTMDIDKSTKDKACNMSLVFRIRNGKLDITVYNRSNDMVWGAYGANVVQFSMIQEYIAAKLGIKIGTYTQVSNSFHVYLEGPGGDLWNKLLEKYEYNSTRTYDLVNTRIHMGYRDIDDIDHDIRQLFNIYDEHGLREVSETTYWKSSYFNNLVIPMLSVYVLHKEQGPSQAFKYLHTIEADDWRLACNLWLLNRIEARKS